MHLFTDYLQPLTLWLSANPEWALLIAFLMAFVESLAIIGSIIPGGVTMTAIGILAGSGVMNISLTLLAAALGAVAGDGASYAIGYVFSDHLSEMWPFRRYPRWLDYGKEYFAKHGGKSVIIGRFFGPLRSIIPVIAGMLRMNPWGFLLANIISAIGWALLYVIPGVLIGAASTELSAESATRLFIFILIVLVATWLITQGMKLIYFHASQFLQVYLRKIWAFSKYNSRTARFLRTLTPKYEINHFPTAILLLLLIVCFLLSVLMIIVAIQGSWISAIDTPCYLFLQSVRTHSFDVFFIMISLILTPLSLSIFALSIAACSVYVRDWRFLRYWVSLIAMSLSMIWILSSCIHTAKLQIVAGTQVTPSFPAKHLTLATAMFGFLMGYASRYYRCMSMFTIKIILTSILFLSGLAALYLGDTWASNILAAYVLGWTLCIGHWIYYRRKQQAHALKTLPIILSCTILLITTCFTYSIQFKKLIRIHSPINQQFVLTHDAWWNQTHPLLPLYVTSRFGNNIGVFNIQYLGALHQFEQKLSEQGWKLQPDSVFYSLLMRASGQNSAKELPLMAQLYLNKKPKLIMTYHSNDGQTLFILRLWRSNYHLYNYPKPLWLGSVICLKQLSKDHKDESIAHLLSSLEQFKIRQMPLTIQIDSTSATAQLLIIEEK